MYIVQKRKIKIFNHTFLINSFVVMNYSFTSQNILSRYSYCKWIVKQYLSQHRGKLITGVAGIILTLLTRQVVRWGITHQDTVALGGNPNIHQIQNIIYTRQVVRWGITHQDTVAILTYIKYKISYTHCRWYGGELHTRIQWRWVAILTYIKYKISYIHGRWYGGELHTRIQWQS